jgi:hypothetical protein
MVSQLDDTWKKIHGAEAHTEPAASPLRWSVGHDASQQQRRGKSRPVVLSRRVGALGCPPFSVVRRQQEAPGGTQGFEVVLTEGESVPARRSSGGSGRLRCALSAHPSIQELRSVFGKAFSVMTRPTSTAPWHVPARALAARVGAHRCHSELAILRLG